MSTWTCLVTQSCLMLCSHMDCSLEGSSVHGDSPGKNTGVGGHAFLQGIFPTQGWNSGLLHCRRVLYQLIHQGSPCTVGLVAQSRLTLCSPHGTSFLVVSPSLPSRPSSEVMCYLFYQFLLICSTWPGPRRSSAYSVCVMSFFFFLGSLEKAPLLSATVVPNENI